MRERERESLTRPSRLRAKVSMHRLGALFGPRELRWTSAIQRHGINGDLSQVEQLVRGCREWRLMLRAEENDEAHRHGHEIEEEEDSIEQNRETFDRRLLIERVQWLVASPSVAQQLPKVSNIIEHFQCCAVFASDRLGSAASASLGVREHQRLMNCQQARSFRR